jgi:hypothetical protein
MLLMITFVELRVVAGRNRTQAGRPHALSGRPMLIHTHHAMPMLCRDLEKLLSERLGRGMTRARRGICESKTAVLCKSNRKEYESLAARHGNGMVCVNQLLQFVLK